MQSADELQRVLRIVPHLRLEPLASSDAVFLVGEREHYALPGALLAAVLGSMDGPRSVEEILASCLPVPPEQALSLLRRLEERGLVTEVQEGQPEEALAFASGMSAGLAVPIVELFDATDSPGGAVMQTMADALRSAGFERADAGSTRGTLVVVAADYLAAPCAERARSALQAGQPCFLVKPGGLQPLIGPYFTGAPGEPCPHCLIHALREQHPVERMLQRQSPERAWPAAPSASLPASVAAAAHLAAIELRRIMGHRDPQSMTARLWTLDFPCFELTEHRVRHRPQCPACGDAELQAKLGERPIELASAPIGYCADGGFRREPPAESYARLRHLVSPVLGPVNFLHPMPGRHEEARPVFAAGYFMVPQRATSTNVFDRNCAGKGCSVEQARMSALAEAIERTSGLYRGDEAVRHHRFEELGDEAIHPADLQLFSASQLARGSAPPVLDHQTRIAWTPAWSLSERRRRWVPLAYCYTEAPDEHGARYCRPSSNGSAAGNCLEEAIFQGLFELIERDAAAIWWYGRARRPGARVPPSAMAYVEAQRAAYASFGWSLSMLDLTHDIGCPVITAVATHTPSDRFALGFGCHPEPALAMRRAISELNQVFDPLATASSPWDRMLASKLDYLWPDPSAPATAPAEEIESRDLKDHIETWVVRLRELGMETLVVDKTRPDLVLRVAQVIVPGLRHPWPRFGPGRLYTVATALGWTARPPAEEELNPNPLLI